MANYDDTATVSGSVVSFSDGADEVGLKSCVVSLLASLSGYSEVNEVRSGKNLASELLEWNVTNRIIAPVFLKNGTYTVSFTRSTTPSAIYIRKGDTIVLSGDAYAYKYNSNSFTFNADVDGYYYVQIYRSASSTTWEDAPVTEPQLEVGSTETDFEAYEAPTTHTASLGRTIYGGTSDIVNGQGSETFARIDLGSLTYTHRNNVGMQSNGISSLIQNPPDNYTKTTAIASDYTADTWQIVVNSGTSSGLFGVSGGYVCFSTTETDANAFKASMSGKYLIFPLATPTSFTFDPVSIETAKGSNTFWSDQGNTELTYYKDGYGFTSVTIHKETPDGEPVEQTAKLHRIIYGGEVDVVNGTCEPKNLFDSADASHIFLSGTNTQYQIGTISLKGGVTYTFSAYQEDALTSNTRNTLVIFDNGSYTYEYATGTNYHNQSGVHSMQYTPNADTTVTLLIWVHTPSNDVTYSEFQVEKGSSASDFAPYFDPFTFPPISMETDEGENTLYADEGDSAIVYRKEI